MVLLFSCISLASPWKNSSTAGAFFLNLFFDCLRESCCPVVATPEDEPAAGADLFFSEGVPPGTLGIGSKIVLGMV